MFFGVASGWESKGIFVTDALSENTGKLLSLKRVPTLSEDKNACFGALILDSSQLSYLLHLIDCYRECYHDSNPDLSQSLESSVNDLLLFVENVRLEQCS